MIHEGVSQFALAPDISLIATYIKIEGNFLKCYVNIQMIILF